MDTTEKLQIKVQDETKGKHNYVTRNLLDCMKFWNREGEKAIEKNKSGEWGSKETNQMAKEMQPDDFLLEMILGDCRTFCKSDKADEIGEFECGRTRSHVWVHQNGERVLMFHA